MKIATQILRYIEVQTIKGIYSNDNKDDNAAFLAITITLAIEMSLLISQNIHRHDHQHIYVTWHRHFFRLFCLCTLPEKINS